MVLIKSAVYVLPLSMLPLMAKSADNVLTSSLPGTAMPFLLIFVWSSLVKDFRCSADSSQVEKHLEQGKKFLAAGQLSDALSQYHAAVEGDPNNFMSYFRRATVYLAMGKSKSALPDLDTVLSLKPDFSAARLQRANVKLKQGKVDEARKDYEDVLQKDSSNAEAQDQLGKLQGLRDNIEQAKSLISRQLYAEAVEKLSKPIETCPWDPELHELRAECYIHLNEYSKAILDLRPTTKLRNDNTAAHYKISQLSYQQGEAEESLNEVRECLKLDADHKSCHEHYKKVKKLVQQMKSIADMLGNQDWTGCIGKVDQMLKVENKVDAFVQKANGYLCQCHTQLKNIKEASNICTTVLEKDPNNLDALCNRAENFINNEQFEEAISDYRKAEGLEEGNQNKRVQDGIQRAQKLLKQSQKKDYYKILGVKRTAQKQEIIRAYRKLAAQWHPDQYNGDDKGHAEKMFIDIASAKEVLTDPEKRAKFDNGEDPLDPEQQAGPGGGPFWHQGFNPFNQGGFQFKFHFN